MYDLAKARLKKAGFVYCVLLLLAVISWHMAIDFERYLEIMRRTGFPVIVAPEVGEPVVLMPLDAYEAFVGADPIVVQKPAPSQFVAPIDPPADLRPYDISEETAPFVPPVQPVTEIPVPEPEIAPEPPKKPLNFQKSKGELKSAEDRFFLEPLE